MIYICKYDGLADDTVLRERCEALLLPPAAEDTDGAKWSRHRERILARMLLNFALKEEYGLSLGEIGLRCGQHGKPYSSVNPQIRFNISHCRAACAVAVGGCETGIDIENKFPYRANLARKVCHPDEWTALQRMDGAGREEQLQYLWSLKESYVKWQGTGLSYGMDRVNFAGLMPFSPDGEGANLIKYGDLHILLRSEPSCTLAVCGEEPQTKIREISERELICGERAGAGKSG